MKEHLSLLGHRVRDLITNFEGVVSSVSFDISGCIQAYVIAAMPNDKQELTKGGWFDTKRLLTLSEMPLADQPSFVDVPGGQDLPGFNSKPGK
jgi:hypothetical protein